MDTSDKIAMWALAIWLLGIGLSPGYWWKGPCTDEGMIGRESYLKVQMGEPSQGQLACTGLLAVFWPIAAPVAVSFKVW